jgi:hypothetical protein
MRFRLSTMLLAVTTLAVALGWMYDRKRLEQENERLNAECAEMFQSMPESTFLEAGDARLYRSFVSTRKILYDASDPEDGQRYRDNRPSKLMSPAE